MDRLTVTVGDDREDVEIVKSGEGKVTLIVGQQWMSNVSLGLLRSIHQAAGAYLALSK